MNDVLLWTYSYSRTKPGQPARTYIQQFCGDTGCSPVDLPDTMNDREEWREGVRDVSVGGMAWWWWCIYIYIYIYIHLSLSLYIYIYNGNDHIDPRSISGRGCLHSTLGYNLWKKYEYNYSLSSYWLIVGHIYNMYIYKQDFVLILNKFSENTYS